MYTHHTEGLDELFVCDVCEAILVSEQGIVQHLRTQHMDELLVMAIDTIRKETEALRRDQENQEAGDGEADSGGGSEEQEELGAPNIDMGWVDKQFYVCKHCDEVFLDKKHLEVHSNIYHDLKELEKEMNGNPEDTTIVTPPQSPKPRRFKRKMVEDSNRNASKVSRVGLIQAQTPVKVITPPQVTNTPISPRNDDLSKKIVDINLLKEDLLNEGPAVDLSGSSYFQSHKSMIKKINVKNFNYEQVSRERGMPGNWFLYVSFFNGGKRKVTEYITPDRKLLRGKSAAIEFMKASKEYTEEEIKGFANHLGVKLNEN